MKTLPVAVLALAIGGAIGYFSANGGFDMAGHNAMADEGGKKEPLYWVAPMDANYQRDKPGKSPMGMDLVPVYAEDSSGEKDPAGTVTVSPAVENNLGVKTTKVLRETLVPQIDTVGYVSFDESRMWQVNSRVSGWIKGLNVNAIGERVKKGDVLFDVYSPELVRAQEELLNAQRIGRRTLVQGAKERLESLGVDKDQIKALLKSGKATQTIAIKAPDDGVIAALNIRNGGYLSPAQTVINGGALDEVWVDAEVFERQSHWIKPGTKARMTMDALPGKDWEGVVEYVYPVLDAVSRTLKVRLVFPNPEDELKPNMFANLVLMPQSEKPVLVVPSQSVIRAGGMERVVISTGEGKYRSVKIEAGREAGGMVEVIDGLSVEDNIVTSAQFMLDSESSQSADLSRIGGSKPEANLMSASATGVIRDVMADHNMLTIEHGPVEEWNWPGMTMNFTAVDGEDLSKWIGGTSIRFLIEKSADGGYTVRNISLDERVQPVSSATVDHSQMDHGQMDHSQMDHSQMDHSQMDHSQMDHSQMDHSQMDHSQMDLSQMDHSQMDHSQMDHSQMDHSQMDHSQMDHSQMGHDTAMPGEDDAAKGGNQ